MPLAEEDIVHRVLIRGLRREKRLLRRVTILSSMFNLRLLDSLGFLNVQHGRWRLILGVDDLDAEYWRFIRFVKHCVC